MGNLVTKSPAKFGNYAEDSEKQYIEENLLFYIDKKKKVYRAKLSSKWYVVIDRETRIRYLLVDYILRHFNLYELWTVFYCQDCYGLTPDTINEAREIAIDNINTANDFAPEKAKRLKRKVWDMDPVLFGLILEFIHESKLFLDESTGDNVLPYFK